MPRKSASSIRVNTNVRCLRIYPTELTPKSINELKTVGMKFSKDQAVHLARVLLAVSQEWNSIDITAHRFDKRSSDDTYHVTVTSYRSTK
jgi:hypothetical protein